MMGKLFESLHIPFFIGLIFTIGLMIGFHADDFSVAVMVAIILLGLAGIAWVFKTGYRLKQ